MDHENLEKTTNLESLDDLSLQIKELVENPETFEETKEEKKLNKKKKQDNVFKRLKNWWKKQSKKKKILIISGLAIFLIVIAVGIFFLVRNLTKVEKSVKENVIVELDNYRYENGTLIFLDDAEEEIGSYQCKNKDEDLCFVSYFSTEDNFDVTKNIYEDETQIIERTPIIDDTFVFINDNESLEDETIQIYNIKDKKMLGESYRLVKKADKALENFILKNNESNYGIVSFVENGIDNILDFSYDYLGYVGSVEDLYISTQTGRNIIINKAGKNLSKNITGTIKGLNKKYVKTINDSGKYSVYDYNGKEIFSDYDFVELYDEYAALVNDKKIELKFYDDTKLHEEEMSLFNTDYLKTNIYDEDNKLIETKESFYILENDNVINLTLVKNDDTKIININKAEGLRNKTLRYINYFNGKLYFYNDEGKTNLLGVYTCSNKNNVTVNADELKNCYLAKDTVYENNDIEAIGVNSIIPVFNERYVFLVDNPDLVNENSLNVVLYDLKNKNSISKYKSVNTYSYTGLDELSFKNVTELHVVAQNKSDKFGVIKIGSNDVTSHIPFKYTELEKIGDYYSLKDDSGYQLVSKSNATPLAKNIPRKIRNYNDDYVTTQENNKYYLYDHVGKKITESGYKYIGLYNTFFAAVSDDNKLSLYMYDNPSEAFAKDISLSLSNYYGSGMVAFRVNVSGLNYTVEVGTNANTYEIKDSGNIPSGVEE